MNRRHFIKGGLVAGATAYGVGWASRARGGEPGTPPPAGDAVFRVRDDVTPAVAGFIADARYADLPPSVIELGKSSILDAFGLAIVGAKSKGSGLLRAYFDSFGFTRKDTRVLGTAERMPLRFAAFANGTSIHMEDFDDTQLAVDKNRVYGLLTHPTAPVFPVALGMGDTVAVSGRDFMLGYHVGVEVACKLAEACAPRSYQSGFHSTGVFGVFGSMAACAKLRGYKADLVRQTMAIAASQASGLIQNFGTLMKPFHAGHAAEAGIVAADLAALGWNGADNILEAQNGFFHAYGGTYDPNAILDKLGKPWTFASPGISIKPYPSGSLTHPGMTELERLIHAEGITAAHVAQVEVGTNSQMPRALHHHKPQKGLEGKFSMEYCLAVLLVTGKAGLNEFTDAVVQRADLQAMIERIRFYVDPEAEAAGYSKMTTILKIHLTDGRVISGRADFGKGSPALPMSYDEVADKFRDCAAYAGWPEAKATQIIAGVRRLEDLPDIGALTVLAVG